MHTISDVMFNVLPEIEHNALYVTLIAILYCWLSSSICCIVEQLSALSIKASSSVKLHIPTLNPKYKP